MEIIEDLTEIGVDVINPQHHIKGNKTVGQLYLKKELFEMSVEEIATEVIIGLLGIRE